MQKPLGGKIIGAGGVAMTPEQVARQREIAQALMSQASDTSPVGHWTAALNRGLQGFTSAYERTMADRAETQGMEGARAALAARAGAASPVADALVGGEVPQDALSLIREFEGFRENPYWDVNAFRTGYGSDTVTLADGSVVPVTQGMSISREDAERDLARRVGTEFMPRAQKAAGEMWGNLSAPQQAALTSIAYNYGSIPNSVAAALASGDIGATEQAIRGLSSHNGGINAGRRSREADIFAGNAGAGVYSAPSSNSVAEISALLSDPWVAKVAGPQLQAELSQQMQMQNAAYEQQLRQQDPMRALEMERMQLENAALRNPAPQKPIEINGQLVDPLTLEVLGDYRTQNNSGFDPDRYRVVGNTLFDLNAEGGPRPVGEGTGEEEIIFGADGNPILLRGSAGSAKAFTEAQGKDVGFATRMRGASEQLNAVEESLTSLGNRALDADPTGLLRGSLQSEDYQLANQAAQTWLLAFLRKDSGAAITASEESLYGRTFMPQPGDSPAVIAQKREGREVAMRAVEAGMSPQQALAQVRALGGGVSKPDPAEGAATPTRKRYNPQTGGFE